ncbi:MAG: hypothetical protein EKK41_09995 [Hyphomicrobiales bacterium]|nr:MAG: hypothetical protein EKK41_09995 [Hyphomicrobiales bacterium]
MSKTVEVVPFFERIDGTSADCYVAGFRKADGSRSGIEIVVPAEMVEHAVLADSQLSVAMNPDGTLALHGDGLSEDGVQAANQCSIGRQSLDSLLRDCLCLEAAALEEDAVKDLGLLRIQLAEGLALVDRALDMLTTRR